MALTKILLSVLLFPSLALAQYLNHPLLSSRDDAATSPRAYRVSADSIRVLAVMVQFPQDNDARTTGNGQFVLSTPTDSTIDAPPRNRRYFQDHLAFLTNYYTRVSRGKTAIRYTVLDSVYTLPAAMATYSPSRGGSDSAVSNLARDTWKLVDASGRVPDFSAFDCFIVFHAGSGRDVDLVSSLGYDPTPFDIPSIYLGLNAFRKSYGTSYQGIPVNNGTHFIQNSIIVPETDSRSVPGAGGDVLLELSINGLLCASMGSYLGLPDLFDTNTGASGIGRFGLMDGQSIFSFSGVFPPEPSAWERYWLGWVSPINVQAGTRTLTLPAVGLSAVDQARVDTVYRIPISNQEYFLVENRNRDPQRNGQTVYSTYNGVVRQQLFLRDTTGFNAFDITKLAGTITDVEDYDWSLPGGVDDRGNFFDGGVLIWHIDESVIAANIGADAVNADPKRRGVDVEEADGSQDIGQSYGFTSAGSGSEEGTALDFWFRGNSSPVNKNIFSPTSYPNSNTNTGANSHITIRDFSVRGPSMTATVQIGDGSIAPLPGFPHRTGLITSLNALTVANLDGDPSPEILVSSRQPVSLPAGSYRGGLLAWKTDTASAIAPFFSNGFVAFTDTLGATFHSSPAVRPGDGVRGAELYVGEDLAEEFTPIGKFLSFAVQDANHDSVADNRFSIRLAGGADGNTVISDSLVAIAGIADRVYFVSFDGSVVDSTLLSPSTGGTYPAVGLYDAPNTFVITDIEGRIRITSRSPHGGVTAPDRDARFGSSYLTWPATAMFRTSRGAERCIAFGAYKGLLYLVDATLTPLPGFPVNVGEEFYTAPALADIDGDGSRDIVIFTHTRILAYSSAGVLLAHFPILSPTTETLNRSPVIADVDGDGLVDIVGATDDGVVFAYNREGKMPAGFPLQAGHGAHSVAVFGIPGSGTQTIIGLAVSSIGDSSVSAWRTGVLNTSPTPASFPWPQFMHDAQHTSLDLSSTPGIALSNDFFPKNRAYNWPNPVYDNKTFIRYFVKEDAVVTVKVFDIAGDFVTQFSGPGIGGFDNEVAWDVSALQSGIYLARIEATGATGSGVAIVKVAIVK